MVPYHHLSNRWRPRPARLQASSSARRQWRTAKTGTRARLLRPSPSQLGVQRTSTPRPRAWAAAALAIKKPKGLYTCTATLGPSVVCANKHQVKSVAYCWSTILAAWLSTRCAAPRMPASSCTIRGADVACDAREKSRVETRCDRRPRRTPGRHGPLGRVVNGAVRGAGARPSMPGPDEEANAPPAPTCWAPGRLAATCFDCFESSMFQP